MRNMWLFPFFVALYFVSTSAYSADHEGVVEIKSDDDIVIGFVHEFHPDEGPVRSDAPPIVFVPGFEVPGFEESDENADPGTEERGQQLIRKVALGVTPINQDLSDIKAIEELADREGFRVFVVEFVDNNQSVVKNSLVLERYLTSGETGPAQSYMNDGTRGVVIGFSMGGIIARHALTKLEHEGRDHHTSLYVSLDSPHRGAFLPSSLEIVTRTLLDEAGDFLWGNIFNLNGLEKRLRKGVQALESEAAKELLGLHIGGNGADISDNFYLLNRLNDISADYLKAAHPSHHSLRSSIALMGSLPLNLRSVAIAHGSVNGFPLHANAQSRNGNHFLTLRAKVEGLDDVINIDFKNDAVSVRKSQCYVRVWTDKHVCPRYQAPSELANVISSPGSFTTALREVDEEFDETDDVVGVTFHANMTAGEGLTTFVPTISALDINTLDWFASANELTNLSPFDQVYANFDTNTQHEVLSNELYADLVGEIMTTESTRIAKRNRIAAVIGAL